MVGLDPKLKGDCKSEEKRPISRFQPPHTPNSRSKLCFGLCRSANRARKVLDPDFYFMQC